MPQRGEKGERGSRGEKGERGVRGRSGPAATREQILVAVRDEFVELRKQLQIQLERTAQIQHQLDSIHGLLKKALGAT